MKTIYIFLLQFIFIFSSYAITDQIGGGDEKGNGGIIVYCSKTKNSHESYSTLDTYEGLRRYHRPFTLARANHTVKNRVSIFIERIEEYLPEMANKLNLYLDDFWYETMFLNDVRLIRTNDSYHTFLEEHCILQQAIVQQTPVTPGDARYYIDEKKWEKLPDYEKSVLILHEIVYRYLKGKSSLKVRRFITLMLSNEIKERSLKEKIIAFRALGIDNFNYNELILNISKNVLFKNDNLIKRAYVKKGQRYNIWDQQVTLEEKIVEFYDTGKPSYICILTKISYPISKDVLFKFIPHNE